MSSDVVIKIENVGKCYPIFSQPRDRLKQFLLPRFQRALGLNHGQYYKEFWALKDINFEVKRGESVGIVGRNGAGKSTLLQIVTGVLAPTTGSVETKGKVAALLELGSGFNPEFTGKENVYMSASILGLLSREIDAIYNKIVEFADIGEFVDQPVKTYSSGMMLRLAFAVQTCIEPDVLIVDEALGVGDARFQLKCARRMAELKERGTSLLFVSHSVEQVRSLCSRGLLLDTGNQLFWGDAKDACARYFSLLFPENAEDVGSNEGENPEDLVLESCEDFDKDGYVLHLKPGEIKCETFGVGGAWIEWLSIYGLESPNIFHGGEKVLVQCKYSWNPESLYEQRISKMLKDDITFGFSLANKKGEYIFGCNGFDFGMMVPGSIGNSAVVELSFVMPYLMSGEYFATLAIALGSMQNHEQQKWYDYCVDLQCISSKKNVYGFMHLDYEMRTVIKSEKLND